MAVLMVAQWEAYVEGLLKEAMLEVRRALQAAPPPGQLPGLAAYDALRNKAHLAVRNLHTPKPDNIDELYEEFLNLGLTTHWRLVARRRLGENGTVEALNPARSRAYLEQWMQIRHAIAHGSELPDYVWLGNNRHGRALGLNNVRRGGLPFFRELVAVTDSAVSSHLANQYGVVVNW
jgi:hypothetical protein